jgi:hypothetical protein
MVMDDVKEETKGGHSGGGFDTIDHDEDNYRNNRSNYLESLGANQEDGTD